MNVFFDLEAYVQHSCRLCHIFLVVHVQIDLVNSTYAELVRSVRLVSGTMDQRDDVTQLVLSDDGDYVYALTAQQVHHMSVTCSKLAITDAVV